MDTSDDPVTMTLLGAGSTVGKMMAARQQGKNMAKIGEARARADEMSAEAARKSASVRASNIAAKGRRFVAGQRSSYAARGIRVESGVVDEVTGATKEAFLRDIQTARGEGETMASRFESSAAIERAQGGFLRQQSRWDMLNAGLSGAFQVGKLGYDADWWGGEDSPPVDPAFLYDTDED